MIGTPRRRPLHTAVELPVRGYGRTRERSVFFAETAGWLAKRLGVEVETLPGGHTPYFDRPQEMAETLRPRLRELSRTPPKVVVAVTNFPRSS